MNTHADKKKEHKSQSVSNETYQKQSNSESTFQFVDNRPEAVVQRKLQEMADNSTQVRQLKTIQLAIEGKSTKLPPIASSVASTPPSPSQQSQSTIPTLPPIHGPSRQARPTTARAATHANNMAQSSFPVLTNFSAWARPQFLGGIPSESRQTGIDIAPQIAQYNQEIREEEPEYDHHMNSRTALSAVSNTASVASTAMSLSAAAAVAAPIVSTVGNVARIEAGRQGLEASKVLAQRPTSPTRRAHHLSKLKAQEGVRDVATGTAGLTQLPGASAITGFEMDRLMKERRTQNTIGFVDGVRRANEKKRQPVPPSTPAPSNNDRSPRIGKLKK
jgi:hypothetical protein